MTPQVQVESCISYRQGVATMTAISHVSKGVLITIGSGALLLLVMFLTGVHEANGETITVDDDGGADYTKIQDAIDNSSAGATIICVGGDIFRECPGE